MPPESACSQWLSERDDGGIQKGADKKRWEAA